MFWNTHLAAGLIVGKVTGQYDAALIASFFADLDHLIPLIKTGVILHPLALLRTTITEDDSYGNERHILHNVGVWLIISTFVYFAIGTEWGIAFLAAYFIHLLLDAIDGANFYPFYPNKRINFRGSIRYASLNEMFLSIILFGFFLLL